jgi:hypothetical protein
MFISHNRLRRAVRPPAAVGPWALDSGGFSELKLHGGWTTEPEVYAEWVDYYWHAIPGMLWASPQDWMCEPFMLELTGLTIPEHQKRTVANYLKLRDIAPHLPFIPVLQGWEMGDYLDCIAMYAAEGVNLEDEPLVGIGSVCRRQSTKDIAAIIGELASCGLKMHGFGVKTGGLKMYAQHLVSADSMAWSFAARINNTRLPDCTHADCRNCYLYAMKWRNDLLAKLV